MDKDIKRITIRGRKLSGGQYIAKMSREGAYSAEIPSSNDFSVVTNILRHHIKNQPTPRKPTGFPYNFEIQF